MVYFLSVSFYVSVSAYNLFSDDLLCTSCECIDNFCPARSCKYQQDFCLKRCMKFFQLPSHVLQTQTADAHACSDVCTQLLWFSEQLCSSAALLTNRGCVTISRAVSQSPVYIPSFCLEVAIHTCRQPLFQPNCLSPL